MEARARLTVFPATGGSVTVSSLELLYWRVQERAWGSLRPVMLVQESPGTGERKPGGIFVSFINILKIIHTNQLKSQGSRRLGEQQRVAWMRSAEMTSCS